MEKKLKIGKNIIAAGALVAVLVGGGSALSASAEGSFTSSVDQVQPGFTSRVWTDLGSDSNDTLVKLTSCKGNKGGASAAASWVKTVGVTLWKNGVAAQTITQDCGTYNFGPRGGSGISYEFSIASENGQTSADSNHFLNANVSVSY